MGYKIKKVYIRQNGVEKQIYPATWNPGENTIAYYPFQNDIKDYSGNGHDWYIARGTTTFSDNACQFNTLRCSDTLFSNYSGDITILAYVLSATSTASFGFASNGSRYPTGKFLENNFGIYNGGWGLVNWQNLTFPNLLVAVKSGTSATLYIGDTINATGTINKSVLTNSNGIYIGGYGSNNETMKVGNLIVENKARTASEISDYYNLTKSNYGL